jgi:hypothetical protein
MDTTSILQQLFSENPVFMTPTSCPVCFTFVHFCLVFGSWRIAGVMVGNSQKRKEDQQVFEKKAFTVIKQKQFAHAATGNWKLKYILVCVLCSYIITFVKI